MVERTAFLEDGLEFVHISEVYSPEHFYVQRAKFRPQLRSLEADMEKKMLTEQIEQNNKHRNYKNKLTTAEIKLKEAEDKLQQLTEAEKRDKINGSEEEEIRVGGVYLADCRDTDDGGIFRVKVHSILFTI